MKWLILLALISCGQKNPPAQDVGDSDGDQIPNYLETSNDKYIAEVIPFGKVEGTMSFKLENKYTSVKFGNEQDIAGNAMKLLTKSLSTLKTDDYFSEWSLLKPESTTFTIPDDRYLVSLSFDTKERPDSISLTDGKADIELGAFSSRMEFTLTGEELRQILAGKLHLNLKRHTSDNPYSVESTIRERTYRVFYFDGKISKIHYVSHELDFKDYLKQNGITESFELKTFIGFTQKDPRTYWWTRNIGEKDKIVVRNSLTELSEFHAGNFKIQKTQIDRVNGSAVNSYTVKKVPGSKFILKFRGNVIQNIIQESKRYYHIGGPAQDDCYEYNRNVVATNSQSLTKEYLLSNLMVRSPSKSGTLNDFNGILTEAVDKDGWFLELAMEETPEEFTFVLSARPQNTYVMTGIYHDTCNGSPRLTSTNNEGQMNIQLESFIEKIE